jgi:hypothetical protein
MYTETSSFAKCFLRDRCMYLSSEARFEGVFDPGGAFGCRNCGRLVFIEGWAPDSAPSGHALAATSTASQRGWGAIGGTALFAQCSCMRTYCCRF